MENITFNEKEHPIGPICARWLRKIEDGKKSKEELFGRYAREAVKFFDGPHDWMWNEEYATAGGGYIDKSAKGAMPMFRMSVNRIFEAVALIGPALYHKNPHVEISVNEPPQITPEELGIILPEQLTPEMMRDPQIAQMVQQFA